MIKLYMVTAESFFLLAIRGGGLLGLNHVIRMCMYIRGIYILCKTDMTFRYWCIVEGTRRSSNLHKTS